MYGDWLLNGSKERIPSAKVRRPFLELMCSQILQSWTLINNDIITKNFKKTTILNALDGTEDNIRRNGTNLSDIDVGKTNLYGILYEICFEYFQVQLVFRNFDRIISKLMAIKKLP